MKQRVTGKIRFAWWASLLGLLLLFSSLLNSGFYGQGVVYANPSSAPSVTQAVYSGQSGLAGSWLTLNGSNLTSVNAVYLSNLSSGLNSSNSAVVGAGGGEGASLLVLLPSDLAPVNSSQSVYAAVYAQATGLSPAVMVTQQPVSDVVTVHQCDEAHLLAAIAATPSGGTVNFGCSGTIVLSPNQGTPGDEGRIGISQNLTINGAGQQVTIDGNNQVGLFFISPLANVTLENLTLKNGWGIDSNFDWGGAIYNMGNTVVDNVTFLNNKAYEMGGAIVNFLHGNLTVENSAFTDNYVTCPVAGVGGGAITENSFAPLSVINSTFVDNVAQGMGSGGAIAVVGSGFFEGTGTLSVTGSTFIGNQSIQNDNGLNLIVGGGAIADNDHPMTVSNSIFENNVTTNGGGAIFFGPRSLAYISPYIPYPLPSDPNAKASISNSVFTGNQAIGPTLVIGNQQIHDIYTEALAQGGAIYDGDNVSPMQITGSRFENNSAYTGGAIYSLGPLSLTNSSLVDNQQTPSALTYGAGGLATYGPTEVQSTILTNNTPVNCQLDSTATIVNLGGDAESPGLSCGFAAPPAALQATQVTASGWIQTWQSVYGASGYLLDLNGQPVSSTPLTLPQYTVTRASPATTYQVTVASVYHGVASAFSAPETVYTPPPAPQGLNASQMTTTGWTESWQPVPGATGYELELNGQLVSSNPVAVPTLTLTGIIPGTTYSVTVAAVYNGAVGVFSAPQTVDLLAPGISGTFAQGNESQWVVVDNAAETLTPLRMGSTEVQVSVSNGTFLTPTPIDVVTSTATVYAPPGTQGVLELGLYWPSTDTLQRPFTVTLSNPAIELGDSVYQLIQGKDVLLPSRDWSISAGRVTLTVTGDPSFVIAGPQPTGGGGGDVSAGSGSGSQTLFPGVGGSSGTAAPPSATNATETIEPGQGGNLVATAADGVHITVTIPAVPSGLSLPSAVVSNPLTVTAQPLAALPSNVAALPVWNAVNVTASPSPNVPVPITVQWTFPTPLASPPVVLCWNPLTGAWQRLAHVTVNPATNSVEVTATHFSLFAVAAASTVPAVARIAGATRITTAIMAAETAFPNGAAAVILANAGSAAPSPDALSAASLAGALHAPILLNPAAALDPAVLAAIEALGANTVYVVGGPAAISDAVVQALTAHHLTVVRQFEGATRYQTAQLIDRYLYTHQLTTASTLFVANGATMIDALSASPVVDALAAPLLLAAPGQTHLAPATATWLQSLPIRTVVVLGGPAAIPSTLELALHTLLPTAAVERLAGLTRNGTAVAIDRQYFGADPPGAVVAANGTAGTSFVDALSAAAVAAVNDVPIVLTGPTTLPPSTHEYLQHVTPNGPIWVMGGNQAVAPTVVAQITQMTH